MPSCISYTSGWWFRPRPTTKVVMDFRKHFSRTLVYCKHSFTLLVKCVQCVCHSNPWHTADDVSFHWCISRIHTHPFSGPLSRTTQVSRNQKVIPNWILLKQETMSGSGISWAICKSAPRSRYITTPAPHHSVFYRPNALLAAEPTASKHWRRALKAWVLKAWKLCARLLPSHTYCTNLAFSNNGLCFYCQNVVP